MRNEGEDYQRIPSWMTNMDNESGAKIVSTTEETSLMKMSSILNMWSPRCLWDGQNEPEWTRTIRGEICHEGIASECISVQVTAETSMVDEIT